MISALLEGKTLLQAVNRGNKIGSLAIQVRGDSEGCPLATRWASNFLRNDNSRPVPYLQRGTAASVSTDVCLLIDRGKPMNSSTNATKRWWYIMPIVFITYSTAYLDRANFSFASAAGITEDRHHQGDLLPAGALFFLGYFFFQIPGAIYAERRSVRKLIFICLILWGGCASLTGIVHNIPALAAIRFILGVVEAAVMPAMLIYISNWFTKSERSRANTFLILGNPVTVLWMSVVSGYLIQAFGWREMFIIEGVPAVIWAFCWWVLVKDKPSQVSGWRRVKSGAAGTTGS